MTCNAEHSRSELRRRRFLVAAAAWPVFGWVDVLRAQSRQQPVRIGFLAAASKASNEHFLVAFKQGLAGLGWKEGSDFLLEVRWAEGQVGQLEPLAQQIAATRPDIVVAAPSNAVRAATKILPKTPVVQANGIDPVTLGLAASLARPGGMVTGVTNILDQLVEKTVELLVTAVPLSRRRVGFLFEPGAAGHAHIADAQRAAVQYKIEPVFAGAAKPEEIANAVASLAKAGAEALVIVGGSFFPSERRRIVKLALEQRWPTVGSLREYAEEGALLSYGADRSALYRRAAFYVDKIAKGTKPGDLPIEQATRFELVINRKTAGRLGITLPQEMLLRADRVIE